ncbi:WecB/TagA/CpsF family glycosyltransferase [Lactobacillus buchneri]|nr:WecB/TagA/CpsF family glycosyltransferase [Lentilactobacillus buchneri]MQM86611.1 WecB/TagA/CpsF family glycosyltransferase [Lentilactobacillus buchneri]
MLGRNKRITIANTSIDVLSVEETVLLVQEYVDKKVPLHLIGVNADKINELNHNKYLQTIVNSCGIINADGASVVLASRFLNKPLPERVAGIDLMDDLVSLSNKKKYTIYLLGARQETVEKTAKVLKNKYKNLKIVGVHNGYFKENDWPILAEELKSKNADFVFVGITSPLKEYIVEYFQNSGIKSVFMGVGGSFDVISGNIPRAPIWIQKANLEWLYRVMKEPRRLFKRYLFGNIAFINLIIKEKFR